MEVTRTSLVTPYVSGQLKIYFDVGMWLLLLPCPVFSLTFADQFANDHDHRHKFMHTRFPLYYWSTLLKYLLLATQRQSKVAFIIIMLTCAPAKFRVQSIVLLCMCRIITALRQKLEELMWVVIRNIKLEWPHSLTSQTNQTQCKSLSVSHTWYWK